VSVHPEAVYSDAVNGALLRVEVVRAHKEGAAGHPDHVLVRRPAGTI
jgi:hypothetical protein